jgi:hypothetical protein
MWIRFVSIPSHRFVTEKNLGWRQWLFSTRKKGPDGSAGESRSQTELRASEVSPSSIGHSYVGSESWWDHPASCGHARSGGVVGSSSTGRSENGALVPVCRRSTWGSEMVPFLLQNRLANSAAAMWSKRERLVDWFCCRACRGGRRPGWPGGNAPGGRVAVTLSPTSTRLQVSFFLWNLSVTAVTSVTGPGPVTDQTG